MKDWRERIAAWAQTQPAIRAIVVVGSSVRRDHPADEWADLDLQVFATAFDPYLSDSGWLDALGTVWVCIPFQTGDGEPERLAVFEGGDKVDFHWFSTAELARMVQAQTLDSVYRRGYEVLVDKDGQAGRLPPPPYIPLPGEKPAAADFELTVNLFWYDVLQAAKAIRRRDLWPAKGIDGHQKAGLLCMIEWHARAAHGWDYDTWHAGKFLREWTDLQTREALPGIFGHWDAPDSWRALWATVDLFRRLATETADRLGYAYPARLDEQVTRCVKGWYERDGGSTC